MLKKTASSSSAKTSIGFKCGECLHFDRLAKFEKPCTQLGVKAFASAPICFTPNVFKLQSVNPDIFYQLGVLTKDFTSTESRLVIALLKQVNVQEKVYKLRFGQPVYFALGNDYLANYFLGYVISVNTSGDELVYVTSDLGKKQRKTPMLGSFMLDSVFTSSKFKIKKESLIKQGRLAEKSSIITMTKTKALDYEVPTLDNAPKEWLDKANVKKGKAGRKAKKELDGSLSFSI